MVNTQVPRHRKDSKPITPFTDASVAAFSTRGIAVASAAGIVLTATVAGTATADPLPVTLASTLSGDFVAHLEAPSSATLVSLDIDWDPGDEVAAVAAEPEPEPEPEPVVEEVATAEVASRAGDRVEEAANDSSSVSEAAIPPAASGGIVGTALQYVGYPYVYGGTSPSGFDCSGFVQYVFALNGISLPRISGDQGRAGTQIPASEAQPGDLVVWGESHIAIYIGDGQIVHASTPATGVKVSSLYGSYYFSRIG